jgi:hypothetical protein
VRFGCGAHYGHLISWGLVGWGLVGRRGLVRIWKGGKVASLWSAFLGRLALRAMGIRAGVGGFHLHAL